MYRKLMFLISLVLLLGLVNSASAILWTGAGVDDSWCTADNWDGSVVPGPADEAQIDCSAGAQDVIVDCDVTIDTLKGPGWDNPSCAQSISFNSGTTYVASFARNSMDGSELTTYNFNGANVTFDSQVRVADDGDCVVNVTAGSLLVTDGMRGGDNGGTHFDINISGGSLTVDGETGIGDDGNGTLDVSSGSLTVQNDNLVLAARDGGVTTLLVSGDGQVFVDDTLLLGKDDPDGDAVVDMEGGTLNVGDCEMHCDGGGGGTQQIIMNAGEFTVRDQLSVGCDGDATVQVNGGTFSVGSLDIGGDGVVDINDNPAALIIDGDVVSQVAGLFLAGKMTAKGSSRAYKADFGVTNPGKTTVMYDPDANLDKAWGPDPANGQTKVQSSTTHVLLNWHEGDSLGRGRHNLYFGTDADAVTNATVASDEFMGSFRTSELPVDVGTLPLWQTFYWRVDEFNELPTPLTPGDLWSFTTGCEAINGDLNNDCLLNFLDYAGVAGTWQGEQFWPE